MRNFLDIYLVRDKLKHLDLYLPNIDQAIEDKKKVADAVIGSDESWLTELDNEAFQDLIALNKSAILD